MNPEEAAFTPVTPGPATSPHSFFAASNGYGNQYPPVAVLQSTHAMETSADPGPNPNIPLTRLPPDHADRLVYRTAYCRLKTMLHEWVPRWLTWNEKQMHDSNTRLKVGEIHLLWERKWAIAPHRDTELEKAIIISLSEYSFHFARTFRINDLPSEILTEIFRYVSWASRDTGVNLRSRIYLSWVCHHWRTVAIADTSLWNSIYFQQRRYDARGFAFLERAGRSPIDIRVDDSPQDRVSLALMQQIMGTAFQKMECVRVIILFIHDWDPVYYVIDALRRIRQLHQQRVPVMLERLEIHRYGQDLVETSRYIPTPLFDGDIVPTFRWFVLNGVYIDWVASAKSFKTLRVFDIRRIAMNQVPALPLFRSILREAVNIQKLILDGAGPEWDRRALYANPVPIPSLKILVIGGMSDEYATFVLSQFACPNVVDVTLLGIVGNDCAKTATAMTGKMPKTRMLSLYNIPVGPHPNVINPEVRIALSKWFQSMPVMQFLRFGRTPNTILQALCADQQTLQQVTMTTPVEPVRPLLFPKLIAVDYGSPYSDSLPVWLLIRRMMQVPFQLYYNAQLAKNLTEEQKKRLKTALGPDWNIKLNFGLKRMPEEDIISREEGLL